ncbi:hypothetical protein NP233_g7551 [Leucocoprinus birnbaumii]|uniref:Nephrocystin 3-like N-terminal domain-containing protein n=1 Tax=Leucocoprinus birnbaumii TaxID=56174 RepID=A0AAD5VP35_9AGAR|nr:hypothetical protein NP233_g7551 [Leucocoprinus birnbaumii]
MQQAGRKESIGRRRLEVGEIKTRPSRPAENSSLSDGVMIKTGRQVTKTLHNGSSAPYVPSAYRLSDRPPASITSSASIVVLSGEKRDCSQMRPHVIGMIPHNATFTGTGPSAGLFPNARDFRIETMNAYEITQNSPFDNSTVLRYLSDRVKKCVPGAMLDSAEREYPPRCDPDTRRRLRNRIVTWVTEENPNRDWRVLWISGPAGVGKSAVAQTIAEEFRALRRLGAAFFFSRPNHLDDPNTLIPTLVYQLAVNHAQYKQILIERLTEDPLILDKNRRAQFKELIIEPFHILTTQYPDTVRDPLLIVIDGLDECCDRAAQRELVGLIGRHGSSKLPLLWMICSRSESHLKTVFSDPDHPIECDRESLDIGDREAQSDSWRILRRGFAEIRKIYADQLEPEWPRYIDLEIIATIASGHLGFVSFVLRFIEDEQYSDPAGQLRVCVRFLKRLPESHGPVNPLHALDLLYYQILSSIAERDLSTAMRIVGMLILYPTQSDLPAQNHANFLELDQATFYRSLQNLHSVLDIPPSSKAFSEPIRIYHASFSDFLTNVAMKSLRWQKHAILAARGNGVYPKLKWARGQNDLGFLLQSLNKYSAEVGWNACCSVRGASALSTLISRLEAFEFNRLQRVPEDFGTFLQWLYRLGPRSNSLVRVLRDDSEALGLIKSPSSEEATLSVEHQVPDLAAYLHTFGYEITGTSSSDPTILRIDLGNDPHTVRIILSVVQTISWTPYSPARSLTTPSTNFISPKPLRSITEPWASPEEKIGPSLGRNESRIRSDKEPPSSLFTSESSSRLGPLTVLTAEGGPIMDSPRPLRTPLAGFDDT